MKIASILALFCAALLLVTSCSKKNDNVVVMASSLDFPPYEFIEDDKPCGIDVEMMEAVCKKIGKTLKVENMAFDSVLAAVQTGKADIGVSGLTVTEDRKKSVDFSISYIKASQMILVPTGSSIKSKDDLKGHKVCGQSGTTGVDYAKKLIGEKNVEDYKTYTEVIQAVLTKKADAAVLDDGPARRHAKVNAGKLVILDEPLTVEEYAIAFKKGNDALRTQIDAALKELIESGEMEKICIKNAPETFSK